MAKGRPLSEAHKKKISISHEARIAANYGIAYPNYNPRACEYFKKFDEENETQGRYAMYGGGEFKIEELGYYPDYINFELKLIMEWDEKAHFTSKGRLKQEDINRQMEIMEQFPDFEFRRVFEKD